MTNLAENTWRRIWLALLLVPFLLPLVASADPLTLEPGDSVAISVLKRDDISGTFSLRSDGTISMHVLGEVSALGLTASQLEAKLETKLSDATQLPASVTVEVRSWRPIFVLGEVQAPGAFGYAPGLTVEQAVALAGGIFRRDAANLSGVDLRISDESAQAKWTEVRLRELAVIRARLTAEAADATSFHYDTNGDAALAVIVHEQMDLFSRRQASTAESIAAATRAQDLARAEAEALQEQMRLLDARIADQAANVDKIKALFDKGLTNSDRLTSEGRSLNADRIERMTASTFEARARQQMAQAEATIAEVKATRQRDIATELAQISSQDREATLQLQSSRAMLAEFGPVTAAPVTADTVTVLIYRVSRGADASIVTVDLAPGDSLLPGDTINVLRLPVTAPTN